MKLRRLARRRARRLVAIALGLAAIAPAGAMAHDPDDDDDRTADLVLTLTGSAAEVQAGDSVVFTASIASQGPRKARSVRAAIVLTGQIPVTGVDAPGWSCDVSGSLVNCSRRLVRPDTASTIAISAIAPLGYSHVAAGAFVASARRRDANLRNNVATADISINNPPVVVDDTAQIPFGKPLDVDVLANDFDPDGDPVMLSAGTAKPAHGEVSCADLGCVYKPEKGYSGPDGFDYTLADDRGGSASGHVTVTVLPPPSEPQPTSGPQPVLGNSAPAAVVSGPTVVAPGQTGGYTTVISNGCKVIAEDVVVRITLPAGATVMSAPSRSVRKGRILTIPIGTLRAGTPRGVGVRLRFSRNGGHLRTLVAAVRSSNGLLTGDGLVINVR